MVANCYIVNMFLKFWNLTKGSARFFAVRLLGISFLVCSGAAASYLPGESGFVSLPAEHGLFNNPAGLPAFGSSGALAGFGIEKDVRHLQLGMHLREFGVGFDYRTDDDGLDEARWSLTHGFSLFDNVLYLGHRAEVFRSADFSGTEVSYSPGALIRPFSFLSLGYTGHRLLYTGPESPSRVHEFGASLRYGSFSLSYDFYDFEKHRLLATAEVLNILCGFEIPLAGGGDYRLTVSIPFGGKVEGALSFGEDKHPHYGYVSYHRALNADAWMSPVVRVPLAGTFAEVGNNGIPFISSPSTGLLTLRKHFENIEATPGILIVILDFSEYEGSWAVSKEIQRAVKKLQESGKKVLAFLDDVRPTTLIASRSADMVVAEPSARVTFRGFGGNTLFYKGLMDKLGIKAEILRHGEYKSAVERYTADSMSQEARSDLEKLYRSRWDVLRSEWASKHAAVLDSFADNALMTADDAYRVGLVHALLYREQLAAFAVRQFWNMNAPYAMPTTLAISDKDLFDKNLGYRPRIALISVEGTITDASAKKTLQAIQAVKNSDFRALLLRINSPGGSAQASERIWAALRDLSFRGIPVVASIGDYGASGGYYIACGADSIFAEDFSVVGSIGIFGGKVDLSGLLQKLNVRTETVKTHAHADAQSFTRGFDDVERKVLQGYMDSFYARFVNVVSRATRIPAARVDSSFGGGRVFSGNEARQNGLIHAVGGMDDALAAVRKIAGIGKRTSVELVSLSDEKWSVLDMDFYGQAFGQTEENKIAETLSELAEVKVWALDSRFSEFE